MMNQKQNRPPTKSQSHFLKQARLSFTVFSFTALYALGLLGLTGCQTAYKTATLLKESAVVETLAKPIEMLDIPSGLPWDSKEPLPGAPTRIVSTWTDGVVHKNGTSKRGFGGRLTFYEENKKTPILVDGQVVIYAFDETNRDPTDNRPTKRFVFPVETIAKHRTDSDLGPSYSFWIPWGKINGPQTDVSLIARFEPVRGALLVGDQSRHRLPGSLSHTLEMLAKKTTSDTSSPKNITLATLPATYTNSKKSNSAYPNRQISFSKKTATSNHTNNKPQPRLQLRSTTISLPNAFKKQPDSKPTKKTDSITLSVNQTAPVLPLDQANPQRNHRVSYLSVEESLRKQNAQREFRSQSF